MHAVDKRLFRAHSHTLFFVLLLASVTIFAYRPAWNGGFVWDDDDYIIKNDLLTASDGLRRIWFSLDSPSQYFPLVYTTFRIERALWGLNPSGYHWVNLLLHVANALLVWRVLARLNVPGAWLAGAIFALHPVQVESVAWITERKNVLMAFFFLLTLLAWIAFIDERTKRPWRFYALALVLYVLALSAKSTACTLPAALLLILWLQKRPITKQRLIQIVPFVILGIGMGLLAVWWERYHQGTNRAVFPKMEHLTGAPAGLHLVVGRNRVVRRDLLREVLCGAQLGSRGRVLRDHPEPCARVYHAVYVSLHVCGGSLSVSGMYRANCARFGRRS